MPQRQPLVSFKEEEEDPEKGGKRLCRVGAACLLPVGHGEEQEH